MLWTILAWLSPLTLNAEPDFVRIKPGADLYASHERASGEWAPAWMPWTTWGEHCRAGAVRAERLVEQNGVTALKVDLSTSGCGYLFRRQAYDQIFVRSDQIEPGDGEEQTEAGIREPGCAECGDARNPLDALSKVALTAMTKSPFVKRRQPEKTADELERYLSCYASKHQGNYERLYRKLFDVIGRTAQVTFEPGANKVEVVKSPEQLQDKLNQTRDAVWMFAKPSALKCVTLRESQFDPAARGATTSRGEYALGLGQQMPIAVKQMSCALHGCVLNGHPVKAKAWVREVWAQVFKGARRTFSPAEYNELMTNAVTGRPCLETMDEQVRDAGCPINSLATLAIAQLEGALTIRRADGRHNGPAGTDYGGQQAFDFTVVTASSNNAGVGTTREAVASTADTSQWARALSTVSASHEVSQNTAALLSCLQGGNFKPPWTMKPGEKLRDCARLRRARAD